MIIYTKNVAPNVQISANKNVTQNVRISANKNVNLNTSSIICIKS